MQFSWEALTGVAIALGMLAAALYKRANTSNSDGQTGSPATHRVTLGQSDLRSSGHDAGVQVR